MTMDRKGFMGCCAIALFDTAQAQPSEADREKEFVKNWLTDLFDSLDSELDRETAVRVMAGCGRGCFRRFEFKQRIAQAAEGSVDKLLEAYKRNFQVWREGDLVHIRYGEKSSRCYCPAARYHPARDNDLHCECTRATHQTIFETALGKSVDVKVVQSLRRGGQTCHFTARIA